MQPTPLATRPHFVILDGLRGVAALLVVAFHLFEPNAPNRFEQIINHGYLAVDFFFLLSGFVIGYAYDDRWTRMSFGDFARRRLVRLQPMVIIGSIIGAIFFYFQSSSLWPNISSVPVWKTLLIMLVGFTMIPVPPALDIRGWNEMYPLNGPGWSLFFEYVVNILYGLFVRRFSKAALSVLVFLSAAAVVYLTVFGRAGDVIGGWSLEPEQIRIGLTRVMYPFFAGLLLFRTVRLTRIPNAFLWCSLAVIAVLSFPRLGGPDRLWMNGLYDSFSIIVLFPLIIYMGASGVLKGGFATRLCRFLGAISYPIYITHYPLIYLYTAWTADKKLVGNERFLAGVAVFLSAIAIAYAALKLYDEPVRRWLNKKWNT